MTLVTKFILASIALMLIYVLSGLIIGTVKFIIALVFILALIAGVWYAGAYFRLWGSWFKPLP
jgi:hypothetical protein